MARNPNLGLLSGSRNNDLHDFTTHRRRRRRRRRHHHHHHHERKQMWETWILSCENSVLKMVLLVCPFCFWSTCVAFASLD
jgi:hypothetical protein